MARKLGVSLTCCSQPCQSEVLRHSWEASRGVVCCLGFRGLRSWKSVLTLHGFAESAAARRLPVTCVLQRLGLQQVYTDPCQIQVCPDPRSACAAFGHARLVGTGTDRQDFAFEY